MRMKREMSKKNITMMVFSHITYQLCDNDCLCDVLEEDDEQEQNEDNNNAEQDASDRKMAEYELGDATVKLVRLFANLSINESIGEILARRRESLEVSIWDILQGRVSHVFMGI